METQGFGIGEREKRWEVLFNHANDPMLVYSLDEQGRPEKYHEVNEAAVAFYGYSRDEFLRMLPSQLVDPEHIDLAEAIRTLRQDGRLLIDSMHVTRDGRRVPVEVHAHRFEHEGREMVVSVCRDASKRKQAEAAQAEAYRLLSQTLERISDNFLSLDVEGTILYVNNQAAEATGKTPEELVGCNIWKVFPQYEQAGVRELVEQALRDQAPRTIEIRSPVTQRWLDATLYPSPEGISIFARDISERKWMEREREALREQTNRTAEQFRRIAEVSVATAQEQDLERTLQIVTDQARQIIDAHQSVTSVTQGTDWTQSITAVSLSDKYAKWRDYDEPPRGEGIYTKVCESNRPMRLTQAELETHPAYKRFGASGKDHPPMRGWLAAPLVGRDGRNLGVIQLSDKAEGEFTEQDESILVQLAHVAAAAIENAAAEQKVREHQQWLDFTLDAARVGTWQWEVATGRVQWSPNLEAIHGRETGSFQGTMEDALGDMDPAYKPEVEALIRESLSCGEPYRAVYPLVDREGRWWRWIEAKGTAVHDAQGQPMRMVGVCMDVTDRVEAEHRLRDSEQRFRAIVEQATVGVAQVNPAGRYLFVNDRFCQITGYTAEQLYTLRLQDITHEEDRARNMGLFDELLEGGEPFTIEKRYVRPDGSTVWVNNSVAPIRDERGRIYAIQAVVFDVTDRREAEEAVRRSEQRFRAIVEQATVGVAEMDLSGRFTFVNERYCQITGYEPAKLYGRRMQDITHAEDLPHNLELFNRLLEEGEPYTIEKRYVRPEGSTVWVNKSVTAIRDGDGKPAVALAVAFDVTDRREAEQRLKAHAHTLDTLNRVNSLLAAELDLDKLVQSVTDAATELSGARFGAFLYNAKDQEGGSSIVSASSGELGQSSERFPMSAAASLFAATFCGEGVIRLEDVRKDRRYAEAGSGAAEAEPPMRSYLAAPVVSRSGQVLGGLFFGHPEPGVFSEQAERLVAGIAAQAAVAIDNARLYQATQRELEQRKQVQRELEELNRTLEQRVAKRTAIAERRAVQLRKLASDLARTEQRERERLAQILHDQLQQLLVAGKFRVSALQNQLPEAGHPRTMVGQVDELLDEAIQVSRSLTVEMSPPILQDAGLVPALEWLKRWFKEHYELEVTVEAEEPVEPEVEDVRSFLFTAARELLFNVVKHAGVNQARVAIGPVAGRCGYLRLVVEDQGKGFDMGQKERDTEGDRFGLFSLEERLQLLGGELEIRSDPGQGTQVVLLAPQAQRKHLAGPMVAEAPEASGADAERPGGEADAESVEVGRDMIRVLLADDHEILREGLVGLLSGQPDIEVIAEAEDGEEAVSLAQQQTPDVVVMDVSMPVLNGVEATQRIVATMPRVRVIGLSMHESEDMARAMMSAGAEAFLTKGGPSDALIAAIRGTLPNGS